MNNILAKSLCSLAFGLALAQTAQAAKTFNVLLPDEREWQNDIPVLSYTDNGQKKDVALLPVADKCGWFQATFDKAPKDAVIALKYNSELKLGISGLWDEDGIADPIDLSLVYDAYGIDELYFITDDIMWPDAESLGWYTKYPNVEGYCQFVLGTMFYDTDQDINTLFSFDEASALDSCSGLQKGIVKDVLGENSKPVFSGSDNAKKCFESAEKFNTLFNYVKDVNEAQCYDMPFQRDSKDVRWTFNSDPAGGFFPLENTSDATVFKINDVTMGPTVKARTKRATELGDSTRNQQFCAQSHTMFTYYENVEFTFSNTDDMWVFVNKKLAIDKGGINDTTSIILALKDLNTTYGKDFLEPGKDYPLDVFYCNRRSAAPKFTFKANVFTQHSVGIDFSTQPRENGGLLLDICYESAPVYDCAGLAIGGTVSVPRACTQDEIDSKIKYSITTREGATPEGCEKCTQLPLGQISFGGIDLTDPKKPVIYPDRITGLAAGSYRMLIEIEGKRTYYQFRIKGEGEAIPASGAKLAQSGFNITMAGQHQFAIVTGSSNLAKTYAVMDLQGRIVRQGVITSTETLVPALVPGSYVVKIGVDYRRVNVR